MLYKVDSFVLVLTVTLEEESSTVLIRAIIGPAICGSVLSHETA